MSVWGWVHEFAERCLSEGDHERYRLVNLQIEAFEHGRKDPDRMLAAIAEGRALAKQLDESWWVLHFDHWRLQALLHRARAASSSPRCWPRSRSKARFARCTNGTFAS